MSLVLAALLLAAGEPTTATSLDGRDAAAVARTAAEGGGQVAWGAIVVHESGAAAGSAESIDRYQREELHDPGGIVHHFVIGNGSGSADGEVEVTRAWARGLATPHLFHRGNLPPAISICLVGDLDRAEPSEAQTTALANLVAALARRFQIPLERVLTHREVEPVGCPGRKLSKVAFLEKAGLVPSGETSIRVERDRVIVERGGQPLLRVGLVAPHRPRAPGWPAGHWPVCRRDEHGAFGPTLVLAFPGPAEVEAARSKGTLSAEEARRLDAALSAGHCPPDDTPIGGELAIHAAGPAADEEPSPCITVEEQDMPALFANGSVGTVVEIVQ